MFTCCWEQERQKGKKKSCEGEKGREDQSIIKQNATAHASLLAQKDAIKRSKRVTATKTMRTLSQRFVSRAIGGETLETELKDQSVRVS